MRLLKDDPRIHFLFVGNGPRRAQIEEFVKANGIANFEYRDYFSREQLRSDASPQGRPADSLPLRRERSAARADRGVREGERDRELRVSRLFQPGAAPI